MPARPTGPSASARFLLTWRKLSAGEQLILAGALLILFVGDLLLSAILGGSSPSYVGVPLWIELPAAEIVLAVVLRQLRPNISWPMSYGLVLSALSVPILLPTLVDVIRFPRNLGGLGQYSAISLLVLLSVWVGAAVLAAGIVVYWRRSID